MDNLEARHSFKSGLVKDNVYIQVDSRGVTKQSIFVNKLNLDQDFCDIEALFEALHGDTVISDPSKWRSNLEAVFDVDLFITFLAVNVVIQNWPNPNCHSRCTIDDEKGEALTFDFLDMDDSNWPLIGKIFADKIYKARYNALVIELINYASETNGIKTLCQNYSALIEQE